MNLDTFRFFKPGKDNVKDALTKSQAIFENSTLYTVENYVLKNVLVKGYFP